MKSYYKYLKQALEQAKIRRGFCAPNPAVGVIIVKNNQIIATGYHEASGKPHAEVEALNKIGDEEARNATLYVTLEPCCHHGKTPPCTDLIIKRGIKRVVYGLPDPNPQVSNKGIQQLKNAGIECIFLNLPEIAEFYTSYLCWWKTKKPFVTAKIALSLDGKISGINGNRVNITGETAKLFTHQQRKNADAILTTAKTIICDDPQLNVRLPHEHYKKPIYILDSQLSTPLEAQIFSTAQAVTFLHSTSASQKKIEDLTARSARCQLIPATKTYLDLNEVIKFISEQGIHDLWIEAGGTCFSAFAQAQLLQKAFIYVAPKWLGPKAQAAFFDNISFFDYAKKIIWNSLGEDGLCELQFF